MLARRQFLKFSASTLAAATALPALARASASTTVTADDFAGLEKQSGGRLGVCLWHPTRGQVMGHREREDFPTASTVKFLLCAAVLAKADAGELSLDLRIPVREQDMRAGASVTGRHVGKDMTVRDVCRGSMVWSDNPAVGLLLRQVGGEEGFQRFLREHGDASTRFVMGEGDTLDGVSTTSPLAMVQNLERFVLGNVLSEPSRLQLADWMIENRTGDTRIRAGMPEGWRVGDKTGGMRGISNDIAVLWPLGGGSPWLLAIYLRDSPLEAPQRDEVVKQAAQIAARRMTA